MEKIRVLVVGGIGYLGRRILKANLSLDHPTYVRPAPAGDRLSFKEQGAHQVETVKKANVVIFAIAAVHTRSHQILLDLKLVDAIKEAGNVISAILSQREVVALIELRKITITEEEFLANLRGKPPSANYLEFLDSNNGDEYHTLTSSKPGTIQF